MSNNSLKHPIAPPTAETDRAGFVELALITDESAEIFVDAVIESERRLWSHLDQRIDELLSDKELMNIADAEANRRMDEAVLLKPMNRKAEKLGRIPL